MSKIVVTFSGVNSTIASYTIGVVDPTGASTVLGSIALGGDSLEFTTPSVAGTYVFSCQAVDVSGNPVGTAVTSTVVLKDNVPTAITVTL